MDVSTYLSPEEAKDINEKFGIVNYNTPPANFEEVDEEWFVTKSTFRIYGFKYSWYQQVFLPNEKGLLSIHCFGSYDGTGFAIHLDYWSKKVRYFKFAGCVHEFRSLTQREKETYQMYDRMCLRHYICDRCGFLHTVDSSD
jgi:hypothetical protein